MPLTRTHAAVALQGAYHLLSRPNIHTVDVLPRTVRGEPTDELAVVVTVSTKKRAHQLSDDDYPIPKAIEVPVVRADGSVSHELVPTDVVEGSPLHHATLDEMVRPTSGGYMISVITSFSATATGTLGVNMHYNGALSVVTNNHVIAKNGNVGSWVYQPQPFLFQNSVAAVASFIPVHTYANPDQPNPTMNTYDFAWASIEKHLAALDIKDIGEPLGTRAPVVGEHVRWIGKTTGTVQHATINSITTASKYDWGQGRWSWYMNVIDLSGTVGNEPAGEARKGDSGSAIVATSDMNLVGLVTFATPQLEAYGTRIPPW